MLAMLAVSVVEGCSFVVQEGREEAELADACMGMARYVQGSRSA